MIRLVEVVFLVLGALAGGYYLGILDAMGRRTPPKKAEETSVFSAVYAAVSGFLSLLGRIILWVSGFVVVWIVGMFTYQFFTLPY